MAANEQPDGILLDVIRYSLNIVAVVGGLVLVGSLLFIMVTQANPQSPGAEQPAQAQTEPTATPAPAGEAEATPTVSQEVLTRGEEIFQSQGCGACHAIEGVAQGQVGPSLNDMGARADELAQEAGVADGATYVRESIVAPNAYISPECPTGPCTEPSAMPANFDQALSEEQLDTLVQYLLAQTGGG